MPEFERPEAEKRDRLINAIRLLEKSSSSGYSKMVRCKAPEILRDAAYLTVRRNDEG